MSGALLTPKLVFTIAAEQLRLPLLDGDLDAIVGLLEELSAETVAMHSVKVGEREPATTYDPSLS